MIVNLGTSLWDIFYSFFIFLLTFFGQHIADLFYILLIVTIGGILLHAFTFHILGKK